MLCIVINDIEYSSDNNHYLLRNVIYGIIISSFSVFLIVIYKIKKTNSLPIPFSSLPFFPSYTRLRKDRILRNPTRFEINEFLKGKEEGASFKEIQQQMGISHPSYLNYHLRRLMEFEFIRNVDNYYFHKGVKLRRPFLIEIKEAIGSGARTPTEVAAKIDSYQQKVRYHMNKHGLMAVCEIDYSKRKR